MVSVWNTLANFPYTGQLVMDRLTNTASPVSVPPAKKTKIAKQEITNNRWGSVYNNCAWLWKQVPMKGFSINNNQTLAWKSDSKNCDTKVDRNSKQQFTQEKRGIFERVSINAALLFLFPRMFRQTSVTINTHLLNFITCDHRIAYHVWWLV